MINQGKFDSNDLTPCEYQFLINHLDISDIKIGDVVSMKSSIMSGYNFLKVVTGFSVDTVKNTIKVKCKNLYNEEEHEFYPWTLLQPKYSVLLVYKRKFNICLN